MNNPAAVDHEVHDLIRERWSPRAFSNKPIAEAELRSLFEAARWAASCFNEQPWSFIVAKRENASEFASLLSCLTENNQRWAKQAAALMVSFAKRTFAHNGKPNRHALHDVGLATAQLMLQATALGLRVHPMAGFSPEKVRQAYGVPDDHEPVAAIAVGYPGDAQTLPDDLRERETSPRVRKPQAEFVFRKAWQTPR